MSFKCFPALLFIEVVCCSSQLILEDALLDVPDLVAKTGYPIETHMAKTEDGYILRVHRIPHGLSGPSVDGPLPVVFLMHGLVASSSNWIMMGPGKALAYMLSDSGYDVWMGNARGNYYSRNHTTMNPDTDSQFWKFSWHEIGIYDLPAMIDLALKRSGAEKLHYVGHSQGGTVFFVMASSLKNYKEKIISTTALAPGVYFSKAYGFVKYSKFIHKYGLTDVLNSKVGGFEVFPKSEIMVQIAHTYCSPEDPTKQMMCIKVINEICGESNQYNKTLLPIGISHTPAGSSARQFIHFYNLRHTDTFSQYDHGPVENFKKYGSQTPPLYNLSSIDVPVTIWCGATDLMIQPFDCKRVAKEIGKGAEAKTVNAKIFSHADFIWGIKAPTLIYKEMIENIGKYNIAT